MGTDTTQTAPTISRRAFVASGLAVGVGNKSTYTPKSADRGSAVPLVVMSFQVPGVEQVRVGPGDQLLHVVGRFGVGEAERDRVFSVDRS